MFMSLIPCTDMEGPACSSPDGKLGAWIVEHSVWHVIDMLHRACPCLGVQFYATYQDTFLEAVTCQYYICVCERVRVCV